MQQVIIYRHPCGSSMLFKWQCNLIVHVPWLLRRTVASPNSLSFADRRPHWNSQEADGYCWLADIEINTQQ